ncbi:MAG: 1-phosphofructokinase family hexose kinase [Tissierellia bacterium]|nr:1-phosphofructokinase family hexose kinase [Tissierellia bacterium]
MIYTVTLNPALDMVSYVDNLGGTYAQTTEAHKYPGGKAINASRMLYNLNIPSYVTGFLGGYPGKFIKDWFDNRDFESFFQEIDQDNRTTMRIKTKDKEMTIAGISPEVPENQIEELIYFLSRVREGDIIIMGGSLPRGVADDIYTRIINICNANKAEFVVDIPPKQTLESLKYHPLLIKPNSDNLALMFGKTQAFETEDELIEHGLKCIDMGAKNVIVSIGKEGAYLFTEDHSVYRSFGVEGIEVNSFNSRDAMIASFIGVYMRKSDPVEAFKMASAAAAATAFVEDFANKEEVFETFDKIKVIKLREGLEEENDYLS